MYRFILVCLQVFACCISSVGVSQDSTRVLNEVKIVGIDLSRFSSGTVVQSLKASDNGSLADIGNQSSIYFKNYGSQQLSTISFRGTSSSQTSVIWNGIPVNSPTLGQTDFSVWPMFFTDQLIIQKGGGSSLFGSGAIGGTVILDNSHIQKDSLINVYLGFGSFGQRDVGFKVHLHSKRLINQISVFRGQLENDFRLENGDKQNHASVYRFGISNKLAYTYKKGRLFSEIAYAENDREIQPTRTSSSRSTLKSENLRAVFNHDFFGIWTHRSTLGFISDKTVFNDSLITTSYRVVGTHAIENTVKPNLFLRYGGTGIYEWADSENFDVRESQVQGHLFASGTSYHKVGSATLNLRQAFYETSTIFIPSIGLESAALRRGENSIRFRGQVSRDYRVPTFNDLFWRPGGNPDLEPEKSLNYEAGTDIQLGQFELGITGFRSEITNWIQWTPTEGVWSPANIREVQTRGIEVNPNTDFKINELQVSISGEYSYVLSTDKGLGDENQLPYVPKHSAYISALVSYTQSSVELVSNFTGRRFTTLSNSRSNRIDGFLLTDLKLIHNIQIGIMHIRASLRVQNIADVRYENLKNTAMPGRAFLLELTTKF